MKTTVENQRHCSGPQSNVWLGYIITLLLTWRNNLRYFQWWNHFTALICHHIISPPWKENVKCSLQWHFYWILTKEYKAFPDRLKNWSRSITGLIFSDLGWSNAFSSSLHDLQKQTPDRHCLIRITNYPRMYHPYYNNLLIYYLISKMNQHLQSPA